MAMSAAICFLYFPNRSSDHVSEHTLDLAECPNPGKQEQAGDDKRNEVVGIRRISHPQEGPAKAFDDADRRIEVVDLAELLGNRIARIDDGREEERDLQQVTKPLVDILVEDVDRSKPQPEAKPKQQRPGGKERHEDQIEGDRSAHVEQKREQ